MTMNPLKINWKAISKLNKKHLQNAITDFANKHPHQTVIDLKLPSGSYCVDLTACDNENCLLAIFHVPDRDLVTYIIYPDTQEAREITLSP